MDNNVIKTKYKEEFERSPYETLFFFIDLIGYPFMKFGIALIRLFYPFFLAFNSKIPFVSFAWIQKHLRMEIIFNFLGICYYGFKSKKQISILDDLKNICYIVIQLVYFFLYIYNRREKIKFNKKFKLEFLTIIIFSSLSILATISYQFKLYNEPLYYVSDGLRIITSIYMLFMIDKIEKDYQFVG